MGLVEKDPIVRLLEELTKRKAAARASLADGSPPDALATIDGARRMLAGALASTLERVDGSTVGDPPGAGEGGRVRAELGRLEAEARRALGEEVAATPADERAADIERAVGR